MLWEWIAKQFTAPFIQGALDAWRLKLESVNTLDAHAVDVAKATLIAEIEARKSADAIIIAEQGRWWTAIIRPLLAAPVVIFFWKVIVWDKVLCSIWSLGGCSTDPLTGDVGVWAGAIVTTYVGGRSLEKIASTIWSRRR